MQIRRETALEGEAFSDVSGNIQTKAGLHRRVYVTLGIQDERPQGAALPSQERENGRPLQPTKRLQLSFYFTRNILVQSFSNNVMHRLLNTPSITHSVHDVSVAKIGACELMYTSCR